MVFNEIRTIQVESHAFNLPLEKLWACQNIDWFQCMVKIEIEAICFWLLIAKKEKFPRSICNAIFGAHNGYLLQTSSRMIVF